MATKRNAETIRLLTRASNRLDRQACLEDADGSKNAGCAYRYASASIRDAITKIRIGDEIQAEDEAARRSEIAESHSVRAATLDLIDPDGSCPR